MAALEGEWKSLSKSHRQAFKEMLPTLKAAAKQIDMERAMPDE